MRQQAPKRPDLLKFILTQSQETLLGNIKTLSEIERGLKEPMKVQYKLLKKILKENKNTSYGKKHKFAAIDSFEKFQKLPIITYPDIKKHIERMKRGEKNVLTTKETVYFAETSGTTSEPKHIPVTKLRKRLFKNLMLMWLFLIKNKNINMIKGKTLYFAGPAIYGHTKAGIPRGAISGYNIKNIPWYAKKRLALPTKIYDITDFDERTRLIALKALQENITQIGIAEPIEAILFFEYLKDNRENLIRELEILGKKKLAKQLKKKPFIPARLWPDLVTISCFKSHMNGLYVRKLREKAGSDKIDIRDPGVYASEGVITLGIQRKGSSGIPALNMVFYEFLEQGKPDAKPVTVDKLEVGKQYQTIITTQEGLYRYNIEDVFLVTGFKRKLPLLQFMHRSKFLDLAGEKCPEAELVNAMEETIKETKIKARGYTVILAVGNLEKKPKYNVLLEPMSATKEQLKDFIKRFDKNLRMHVLDYGCMRDEYGRLDKPILTVLKQGSYDAFEKERVGKGQPKIIIMSKDPAFIEQFSVEATITY